MKAYRNQIIILYRETLIWGGLMRTNSARRVADHEGFTMGVPCEERVILGVLWFLRKGWFDWFSSNDCFSCQEILVKKGYFGVLGCILW